MAFTWQVRNWWADYLGKAPDWVDFMGRRIRVAEPFLPALSAMDIVLRGNGYELPTIVGSYFNRNIAGTSVKSIHAYGVAVDLDPWDAGNPHFRGRSWSWSEIKFTREQVAAVRAIRNTRGSQMWRWLGEAIGDTMHWQANVPPRYADVDWSTVEGEDMAEIIQRGDTGNTVSKIQKALNGFDAKFRDGDSQIVIDGVFDADVELRVKAYQRAAGLPQTGAVGGLTYGGLLEFVIDWADPVGGTAPDVSALKRQVDVLQGRVEAEAGIVVRLKKALRSV